MKPARLVEGAILVCTGLLVVGTSTASDPGSWSITTTIDGTAVVLDEATPDLIAEVDFALSASTIEVTDAVRGELILEATLSWNPPASDPGAVAPEVVVGIAQSSFAPEGGARAAGVPTGTGPLTLTAFRGALTTCDLMSGCEDRMRIHFLASALPAGSSIDVTWTLTGEVVGNGRTTPPPGVAATLTEVVASP